MSKRPNLSIEELTALLRARFNSNRANMSRLDELMKEVGVEQSFKCDAPDAEIISAALVDTMCELVAKRLKRSRRSTPLLSPRDFPRHVKSMLYCCEELTGYICGSAEFKTYEALLNAVFGSFCDGFFVMVPDDKNPYDEYWRWIATTVNLAAERGVSPIEFYASQEAVDEITRRMFNKDEFIALISEGTAKLADPELFRKIILEILPTVLKVVPDAIEANERQQLEQGLDEGSMPGVRDYTGKVQVALATWVAEEASRIYATA